MKKFLVVTLYKRLLLTLPFVIVTAGYYKIDNPDEMCNSPLSAIIFLAIYCILFLTGILAFTATFRKRPRDKPTPEPISLSISSIAMLLIIYNLTLRGHRKGDEWIHAKNKNLTDVQESQDLTLRKNGNFTFCPNFDCAFSSKYERVGDTIIFDKEMIDKVAPEMTTAYLLKADKLIPLFDTVNKITFKIQDAK